MTSNTASHRFVISAVFLAVAVAVGITAMASSGRASPAVPASSQPTMSADMPGMDHGSVEIPVSSPSPTMAPDMPGMDHGSAEVPASSPSPTMSADMPGMDHGSAEVPGEHSEHGDAVEAAPDRPLTPVLGTFGGGTSAVLLSAGLLRHRDRDRSRAKAAARAAQRSPK